jgi:hypothetical protein
MAAGLSPLSRVVARKSPPVVEPERLAETKNLGFRKLQERRDDPEAPAADAGGGAEIRHALEGAQERGATVGVAGVVDDVGADPDLARADRLRPGKRMREEERVAGGHVRRRDPPPAHAAPGDGDLAGRERRARLPRQIDGRDPVLDAAESPRELSRERELDAVPLPVVEGERVGLATLRPR